MQTLKKAAGIVAILYGLDSRGSIRDTGSYSLPLHQS